MVKLRTCRARIDLAVGYMDDGERPPIKRLEEDRDRLQAEVARIRERRTAIRLKRDRVQAQLRPLGKLQAEWLARVNAAETEVTTVREQLLSVTVEKSQCSTRLTLMMQINVANDCFYIWHMGPFATINGVKLGRLPSFYPVEWADINAALGQAALLLCTVVERAGFELRAYRIQPMGSFSKVVKNDDPSNARLNLFYDDNFSFFPKRNFNTALTSFLKCLEEFGEYVEQQDPTLRLPYRVQDGKIDGISITLTPGMEEQWTRALKYMMTNIKWLVAWSCKHVQT